MPPRSPEEGGSGVGTDHFVLLPRIWQLRHNFSAYDAAYIVLAEKLALPGHAGHTTGFCLWPCGAR